MATMEDVARAAGVSTTTVSHVLNRTRPVSAETTNRVMAAIEETGYSQHAAGRGQGRARTGSLGLAVGGLAAAAALIAAVERAAARTGHTLVLAETHDDPERELEVVQALAERRVDGLLLAPSPGAGEGALRYLATRPLPVVLLDRFVDASLDRVGFEHVEPTAQLVDHLASCGHRRIAMVTGPPQLATTVERLAGYELGLERHGLAFEDALVETGGSAHRLLDLPEPPTALVSGDRALTLGVLGAARERGLSVPGDLALVAFGDLEGADVLAPRLTVMRPPTDELAEQAVSLLLSRLDDPALEPRSVRLPATFVHRDSCGC